MIAHMRQADLVAGSRLADRARMLCTSLLQSIAALASSERTGIDHCMAVHACTGRVCLNAPGHCLCSCCVNTGASLVDAQKWLTS